MTIRLKVLTTAGEVIDAVGGTTAAARLARKKWPQSATNWRAAGRFPSDTFLLFQADLRRRGFTAPPTLWGITDPAENTPGASDQPSKIAELNP